MSASLLKLRTASILISDKAGRLKGDSAHVAAFRQAAQGGTGMPTEAMLATMRAAIRATDKALAP